VLPRRFSAAKRRTSSSTARQLIDDQSPVMSSGPFTTATVLAAICVEVTSCVVMASNLPFGSGVIGQCMSSQTHLAHVGTLSGSGRARIRPVIRKQLVEDQP